MSRTGQTFAEFYAVYLADHRHPLNRALHLAAKLLAAASLLGAVGLRSFLLLLAAPVLAVAPCWLGHLWFEGNRPVSWERPSASLLGTLAGWAGRLMRPWRPAPPPPAARRQAGGGPAPAAGGRAYYSFLADLRMCGSMLVPWRTAGSPRDASEPT